MPKQLFELLDDRILVNPIEEPDKTPGGILIPEIAKQKSNRGRVIAVGPGRWMPPNHGGSNYRQAVSLAVGDEVYYPLYAGNDLEIDGYKYRVMKESEVLLRVKK